MLQVRIVPVDITNPSSTPLPSRISEGQKGEESRNVGAPVIGTDINDIAPLVITGTPVPYASDISTSVSYRTPITTLAAGFDQAQSPTISSLPVTVGFSSQTTLVQILPHDAPHQAPSQVEGALIGIIAAGTVITTFVAWFKISSRLEMAAASTSPSSQPSQIPALVPAPAGWSYIGCYHDTESRVLDGGFRDSQDMTVISCISICQGNGFNFAGVEGGSQCFCGNSIKTGAVQKTEPECGMPCTGDASQRCGDIWRLNIYQAQATPSSSSSSSTVPGITNHVPAPSPSASHPSNVATSSPTFVTAAQSPHTGTRTETTVPGTSTFLTTAHSTTAASSTSTSSAAAPPTSQIITSIDSHSPRTTLSLGTVAGIAVGVTAITIILVVLLIASLRKWRKRRDEPQHVSTLTTYTTNFYDMQPVTRSTPDDLESDINETSISQSGFVSRRANEMDSTTSPKKGRSYTRTTMYTDDSNSEFTDFSTIKGVN
ncbi:hypothetical protein CVT24_011414 [Panaeolus cyanescens]|uniref:WSC domain-containing protein n=1 Tax=Panaeolus cyanescens TaxID=181874 RepID=A0A409VG72_9AGAR|nr:hypothetical protein CVT24_011414 [Panaeolus cyanescens]